ncbi:hypothetical protein SDC9_83896 [bioreactor metagenome]|uniref:Uncharacterized protein n=1 Tax=bioreactor metagenome TaxID=1076179 RepID=A0A644Z9G2_9ZZZZ
METIRVRYRPQRPDAGRINAGNGGTDRRGAGGQHQLVIGLLVDLTRLQLFHAYSFLLPVNGEHLVPGTHIHAEPRPHDLGLLYQQRVPGADHVSHIIGQSAVGVGDILPALQKNNLRGFVQSAQTCGAAGASGNAAHNHDLRHNFLLLTVRPPRGETHIVFSLVYP